MNLDKLKRAEEDFLMKHPMGFDSPDLEAIGKKHKVGKMIEMAQDSFKKSRFSKHREVADSMVKVIGRSSMVSMFEKPKFRDFVPPLLEKDLRKMTNGLKNFLHGNQEKGFTDMVTILQRDKLAKWSLVTIIPNYYHPQDEVFVKPTTAKGVIQFFELEGLEYRPAPTWDFYQRYREAILQMKEKTDKSLQPNNAAFCGFLMMSMNSY